MVAMKSGHLHAVHAWSHGSACIAVLRRCEATPAVRGGGTTMPERGV